MRRSAEGVTLDAAQTSVADSGVKAMIPIGRPFLDYVLSTLADAGLVDICVVVGPEHQVIRDYYGRQASLSRVRVSFAVQADPLGTANAVAAAAAFAGGDEFLVLNSDNHYPEGALRALRLLGGPGLVGFDREALARDGNIDDARVSRYAVLEVDDSGYLTGILEKPDADAWRKTGDHALISMNCWRFGPEIFRAAAGIGTSARGEFELADAVKASIAAGTRYEVVPVRAGVLDLSSRADIPGVMERLRGVEVRL
jgi:dTDP-glucose pyrophosphorylase